MVETEGMDINAASPGDSERAERMHDEFWIRLFRCLCPGNGIVVFEQPAQREEPVIVSDKEHAQTVEFSDVGTRERPRIAQAG